jgi:superfamily II DNA or RNA helicase
MLVQVKIKEKLYFKKGDLPKSVQKEIRKSFTYKDPQFSKLVSLGYKPWFSGMKSKMATFEETDSKFVVWRGGLKKLTTIFKRSNIDYVLIDKRLWHDKIKLPHTIKLRDYQVKPADVLIRRQQTLLKAPCSYGKTEVLLHCVGHFRRPTLVLVWQERQQKVWVERIEKWFGFTPGGIGGAYKQPMIKSITVGLLQSVRNKLDDLKDLFSVVIADEVQRFAAETFRAVINELPAAIRLGASDDERRKDRREFLLYDTFGTRGYDAGDDEGQVPVNIYAVPTRFSPDMETDKWAKLITALTEDRVRNKLIVTLACREVEEGKRVILFSDRVDHCRSLKYLINKAGYRAGLLLGGNENKREADKTQKGLIDGSIEIGIGTSVAEQSINIPPLNVGIMTCCSADSDLLRFRQMRGRIARPDEGKESARLYYIWDKHIFILKRKLYNIKKRYKYKILVYNYWEDDLPTVKRAKVVITMETLKRGCEDLGIEVPAKTTAKKLEKLITRELAKDKTYGGYSCGACFKDITDGLDMCSFCATQFVPIPDDDKDKKSPKKDVEVDEEETEEEETEEEVDEEETPEADDDEEEEEEDTEEDEEEEEVAEDDEESEEEEDEEDEEEAAEDKDEELEEDEDQEETEDEEEDDEGDMGLELEFEGEDEEEEEDEKPKKKKKVSRKKLPTKKSDVKRSRSAVNQVRSRFSDTKTAAKKRDLEEKYKVIEAGLPYSEEHLAQMKRSALLMTLKALGVKNPIGVSKTGNMVKTIMAAQKEKFGTSGKQGKKPSKKKAKKVSTSTKKTTGKKKKLRKA